MQIPQSNLRNMLSAISNGNHVFNETVQLYRNTKTPCTTCTYDPVRRESTDPYCQTCDGTGFIITLKYFSIPASVETESDFTYDYSKVGKFTQNQMYMTIDNLELTTVLNIDKAYDLNDYKQLKDFVESFDYVIWKGAKFAIGDFEPGILQGNLYEIGCKLSLME